LERNAQDRNFLLYLLAINTGMRRGELCGLKWAQVNFHTGLIEVIGNLTRFGLGATKTNLIRYIPMNLRVRQYLLLALKSRKSEFVLSGEDNRPYDTNHVYRNFADACKRAGVRQIRFHDLRHTFASQFMMKGGNIYDLQNILGHTSLNMTQRYAHLSPAYLAGKTEILNFGGAPESATESESPTYSPHGQFSKVNLTLEKVI